MLCDFLRIDGAVLSLDGHQFLVLFFKLRDDDLHSKLFFLFKL